MLKAHKNAALHNVLLLESKVFEFLPLFPYLTAVYFKLSCAFTVSAQHSKCCGRGSCHVTFRIVVREKILTLRNICLTSPVAVFRVRSSFTRSAFKSASSSEENRYLDTSTSWKLQIENRGWTERKRCRLLIQKVLLCWLLVLLRIKLGYKPAELLNSKKCQLIHFA